MATLDFRKFIQKMLERANINQEYRVKFTDADGMQLFLAAVTHPTFNAENNYQELEFIGDGIIKGVLSQYIPRRFPALASGGSKYSKKGTAEGVLSKTRRFLEQRKTLSDFALKLGFWDYVRADEGVLTKLRKETLEDVFEAFVGALVEIVDQRVKRGLGYYYAYNFVESSLNEIEIEISKETLDDPITRLNELYKANELKNGKIPLKWGDALYITEKMYIPKVDQLPPISSVNIGDLAFSEKDKNAFVATSNGWIHVARAPLIEFYAPHSEMHISETGEIIPDETKQMMWYAGVYGFPHVSGPVIVNRETKMSILQDPKHYGAEIIGQGIHFTLKEAKKLAATQALNYLQQKGYRK
jgi:dsRNA-specific ribonuclease